MLNFNVIIIVIVSIFLVFFGWKLRKIYKRIVFFILKRHAKKSEKEAIVLLKKHNFDIIDEQFKVNHYLYENDKKSPFPLDQTFWYKKMESSILLK